MDANTVYPHPIYRLYLVFIHEVGNSKQAMHTLQNLKQLLQLDHELPVRFLQIVAEVFLARVDRFAADLQFKTIPNSSPVHYYQHHYQHGRPATPVSRRNFLSQFQFQFLKL